MKRINIRRAAILQLSFVLLFCCADAHAAQTPAKQRATRKTPRTTTRTTSRVTKRPVEKTARAAAANKASRAATEKASLEAAQTHFADGLKQHRRGLYRDAAASFDRAISLAPALPSAHYNLGRAREKSGQYMEALKAYAQAARLNPNDADAHSRLGTMQNYFGLHKEAVLSLRQALRLRPDFAPDLNVLASAFYRLGQYTEAATTLESSLRIAPDAATYENLGGAYLKLGRTADVATAKRRAARLKLQAANTARPEPQPALPIAQSAARTERATAPPRPAAATPEEVARLEDRASTQSTPTPVVQPRRESVAPRDEQRITPIDLPDSPATTNNAPRRTRDTPPATNTVPLDAEPPRTIARTQGTPPEAKSLQANLPATTTNAATTEPTASTPNKFTLIAREGVAADSVKTEPAAPVSTATRAANTEPAKSEPAKIEPALSEPAKSEPAKNEAATITAPLPTNTYRVGVGDVLDVRLLNAPAAGSTLYTVLAGGLLEYPLAGGAVPIAGLEPKEIAAELKARVKVYDAPEVVVSVREYASHTVSVSGLVSNPGTKVLRSEAVPLYVLLADAQPRTEAGRAVILSPTSGESRTVALDDAEAINTLVRPNDVITVQAPAAQFYYISGAVNDPGEKTLRPNTSLTQAVLAAGIFSRLPSEVQISRKSADGATVVSKYNLKHIRAGRVPDPALRAGDWIEVVE